MTASETLKSMRREVRWLRRCLVTLVLLDLALGVGLIFHHAMETYPP